MSLCHAWGASPLYLLGRYYLGVKPTAPGYRQFVIEPQLGGLAWIEGSVPTPRGDIQVAVTEKRIKIVSAGGQGTLRLRSASTPRSASAAIRPLDGNLFEMTLDGPGTYTVDYQALR
jgi:hypothetical protein